MKVIYNSLEQKMPLTKLIFRLAVDEFGCKRIIKLFLLLFAIMVCEPRQVHGQINFNANVQKISGERIIGQILRVTKDSLYLVENDGNGQIVIAGSDIKTLRIKKKGATGRGFIVGAATGIFIGGLIGYATYSPPDCDNGWCIDFGPETNAIGGATLGFVTGSLLGIAIGASGKGFKSENGKGILENAVTFVSTASVIKNK